MRVNNTNQLSIAAFSLSALTFSDAGRVGGRVDGESFSSFLRADVADDEQSVS